MSFEFELFEIELFSNVGVFSSPEVEPHHLRQFSVIFRTLLFWVGWGLIFFVGNPVSVFWVLSKMN